MGVVVALVVPEAIATDKIPCATCVMLDAVECVVNLLTMKAPFVPFVISAIALFLRHWSTHQLPTVAFRITDNCDKLA